MALDTVRPSSRRPTVRVSSILPQVGREQQAQGGLTIRGVGIKAHTEKVAMADKYVPFDGMIMSRQKFVGDRSTAVFTAYGLDALRSDIRWQFHGRVANISNRLLRPPKHGCSPFNEAWKDGRAKVWQAIGTLRGWQ
jgi:hypothetical protein